jgi:hypothetical protein
MKVNSGFISLLFLVVFGFMASILFHQANLKKYTDKIAELENENLSISNELIRMSNPLNDSQLYHLMQKGLKDPPTDLRDDLKKHPGLIPYRGELGGTFRFSEDQGSIRILNEKWVLAAFSDGHVDGELFLQFDVSNNSIKWRVIGSFTR